MGFTREARDGMRVKYVPAEEEPGRGAALAAVTTIGSGPRQRPRPIDPSGSAQ